MAGSSGKADPTSAPQVQSGSPTEPDGTRSSSQAQIIVLTRVRHGDLQSTYGLARSRPTLAVSRETQAADKLRHMKGRIVGIKDLILHMSRLIRTLVDK